MSADWNHCREWIEYQTFHSLGDQRWSWYSRRSSCFTFQRKNSIELYFKQHFNSPSWRNFCFCLLVPLLVSVIRELSQCHRIRYAGHTFCLSLEKKPKDYGKEFFHWRIPFMLLLLFLNVIIGIRLLSIRSWMILLKFHNLCKQQWLLMAKILLCGD